MEAGYLVTIAYLVPIPGTTPYQLPDWGRQMQTGSREQVAYQVEYEDDHNDYRDHFADGLGESQIPHNPKDQITD